MTQNIHKNYLCTYGIIEDAFVYSWLKFNVYSIIFFLNYNKNNMLNNIRI